MSHIPSQLDGAVVAKHSSRDSCWVIIKGQVYDVTEFLDSHPGGANIILQYAGKDATEEYDPIHPAGTIETSLPKDKHLGPVDMSTVTSINSARSSERVSDEEPLPLSLCLSLDDIEASASKLLSRRAYTFYHSAADTLTSLNTNLDDWRKITFRPRIMRNVAQVDMSRRIMGQSLSLPFFCAPAARARLAHEEGELCIARGAARFNMGFCTSNVASVSHKDLMDCLKSERKGGALFFQLYVPRDKPKAKEIIANAKALGYKALVITVDSAVIGKREEDERYSAEVIMQAGMQPLQQQQAPTLSDDRPTLEADLPILRGAHSSTLDWNDLPWISECWGKSSGPILLKGIQSAEDAKLAFQHGIDGIYLSNHGGRQADHAPSSVRTLLEIRRFCPEILGKMDIYLDGGVRRGADVLKAVALGATGVGLGRPFLYACAYGTEGVEKAIQILSDEVETTMRLIGVTDLSQLTPDYVNTMLLERELPPTIGQLEWYRGGLKSKL